MTTTSGGRGGADPKLLKLSERVFKRIITILAAPPDSPPTLIEEREFVDAVLTKKLPRATARAKKDGEGFVNNIKDGMIAEGYLRRVGTKIGLGDAVRVRKLPNGKLDGDVDAGGGRMVLGPPDSPKIMPLDNGRGGGDLREWRPFGIGVSPEPLSVRDPNCPDCSIWHYCEKHRDE